MFTAVVGDHDLRALASVMNWRRSWIQRRVWSFANPAH